MERARIRRRRQQFQTQFEIQAKELRDVLAAQLSDGSNSASTQAQRVLKLQYQLGELCGEYEEFSLAAMYFQQILTSLDGPNTEPAKVSDDEIAENAALRTNALNWLAVMHFRAGNQSDAMDFLLLAKKHGRDEASTAEGRPPMDKLLTANYALFLHAKGDISDAEAATQVVVNEGAPDPREETEDDTRARSTAFMRTSVSFSSNLRSSCR
jgi:hypothetical protein